ncbi:early endosome antigen 1 [Hemiscyllium ocellatum]|uniref:early endosome antigen 1 n=1 Tax=Hemiscyllium ocellatum TaxID=170820 RepID=UPI0029668465|nr:early endosome antigen 1 [Hemiscyllium ocellatum]
MKERCRLCAAELRGTRRRWIFGSSSGVDLGAVLSHVLGRRVCRGEGEGDGEGEFLCGKCASSLQTLYRFDGVIARVRALSLQKVRELLGQRERLRHYLLHLHSRRRPAGGDSSTAGGGSPQGSQYEALLEQELALSAYECWSLESRPWGCACPGRSCSGCSAFRVSDAAYESVCRFPRRLAPLRLSRDKSRSMPLDWGVLGCSPGQAGGWGASRWRGAEGSPRSDGGWPRSRSLSASSLGAPPSSEPYSDDTLSEEEGEGDGGHWRWALSAALASLRAIAHRPVPVTPRGSKIPVRTRAGTEPALGARHTPGEYPSGIEDSFPEMDADLSAEYLPFDLRKFLEHDPPQRDSAEQMIAELQKHLETARHHIQTLEKQLNGAVCSDQQQIQVQPNAGQDSDSEVLLTKWLTSQLHSKERLLQQCLELLRQLLSGSSSVQDVKTDLVEKLRDQLRERDGELQGAAGDTCAAAQERDIEAEGLRTALRQKDLDLKRLTEVVARNEEMIQMLGGTLKEKDTVAEQLEAQCKNLKEVGSRRERERMASLQEKDHLIAQLRVALNNSIKDVEALTDSVLSRGLESGCESEPAPLGLRLKEKAELLGRMLSDQERRDVDHREAIADLLSIIGKRDQVIQELSQRHREVLASEAEKVRSLRTQLSAREREVAKLQTLQSTRVQECLTELEDLRGILEHKDQVILGLLEDGQARDRLLSTLQEQLSESVLLKVTMKQTL